MPQVSVSRLALLFVIAVSVLFTHLGSARLWDRDEPRNSRASHEMLARGDWIVPTFNGELRDHKPVLLYWGQMLSYLSLGESEFSARLPSALSALLAAFAVAVLATRLSGTPTGINRNGFWAAGALVTCLLFVMAGRAATPDAVLIAFSTAGIASLVISTLAPAAPYSSGHVRSARWIPAAFGYTMLGLAALAKGPVGIILPLAVVHAWWMICYRQQKAPLLSEETASKQSTPPLNSHLSRPLARPTSPQGEDDAQYPLLGEVASDASGRGKETTFNGERDASGTEIAPLSRSRARDLSPRRGVEGLLSNTKKLLLETWRTFHPLQCLRAIWALKTIPGLLLTLLAAAPWYAAVGFETDGAFLRGFFLDHNVGRAVNSMEGHSGSIFFYPIAFLVGTFPWSLWLIPIILWARKCSRESMVHRQLIVLGAVWISVYVIAFSIASTKLPSYITPCYAGAALLIGGYWRQFESEWSLPTLRWRSAAHGLAIVVGIAMAAVMFWLSVDQSMPLLARAALCGGVIASVGLLGFLWEIRKQTRFVPTTWLVGAAVFQVLLFGFGAKTVDGYRQDLALLESVQQETGAKHWLSIGGMEPSWVHYLDTEIVEIRSAAASPDSWQQVGEFLNQYPDGNVIIVGDEAKSVLATLENFPVLSEVDASRRFLRPGSLSVYRRASQIANTSPAEQGTNR